MEHVVFFPGPDAAPAFRRFPSLEEAVRFVEHLRNAEGVSEVSVHMLSPVPVAFRAYYKAEVSGAEVPVEAPVAERMPEPMAEPMPEPMPEPVAEPVVAEVPAQEPFMAEPMPEPVVAEASSNGKRSLGFFAH